MSHQKNDKAFVKELGNNLLKNNVDVFYDDWDIHGGDSIPFEIENALDECNIFLYVLSPAAITSKWVNEEYYAFLYRKISETNLRIIPLLRETCNVPPFVRPLKYIDFRNFDYNDPTNFSLEKESAFKELMEAIFRKKSKPSLGSTHPSLASYEFYFQPMKNKPRNTDETLNYEIGFKNITDSPLLNFEFTLHFREPVISIEYDVMRSSANMTGGQGLTNNGMTFNWFGNQIMEDNGWVVFTIKTGVVPRIQKISTKLLGRVTNSDKMILPDN